MYIAERQLKVIDRADKKTIYHAGDEIPDFETWNIVAQRSHLNLHWVRKVDTVDLTPTEEPGSTKCGQCDRGFQSVKALRIHTHKAHP